MRRLSWTLSVVVAPLMLGALAAAPVNAAPPTNRYDEVDLVSDVPGRAQLTDPLVVNPWGLALSPTSPLWVANNGTGTATLYRGASGPTPITKVALEVAVSGGAPTGQVFNGTTSFVVSGSVGSGPARFLFVSEGGDVTGWTPAAEPTTAVVAAHTPDAVYKGLALVQRATGPQLLAADFHHGRIDVFDAAFHPVTDPTAFIDPALPAGYAPFNVFTTGGFVYVAYAKQDAATEDEVAGHGFGFVDRFDLSGHGVHRVASHGKLNAPWGMAIAPASFGPYAGALLVGNFGDGRIGAYSGDEFLGQLRDRDNRPIEIDGLWALLPGTATSGGTDGVWFSAGIDDEQHGLVGLLRQATG
jgi:uncharacterized protein (TIGR03118 family)